ncbi:MAG TPA: phosphoribosyltransferase family protein [Bryobacteraceae bacterium]|nr:phosphoribosyltransferase family protein [Bryobacteraceae bacterium]
MQLIPTESEVLELLRKTGALRTGHFVYPNGLHSDMYLQVPIAMRHYQDAKLLSVALSRKLRAHSDLRAMVSDLSIVTPATGGLPVAFGVCEALQAKQVYWAESNESGGPLTFRPHLHPKPGEKVLLVDDILRTGKKLTELRKLIESYGASVVALAVIVYQPNPETPSFGDLPFYYLVELDAMYYADADAAEASNRIQGEPERVWI